MTDPSMTTRAMRNSIFVGKLVIPAEERSRAINPREIARNKNKMMINSASQLEPKSDIVLAADMPLVDKTDIAKIKLSKPGMPDKASAIHKTNVNPR